MRRFNGLSALVLASGFMVSAASAQISLPVAVEEQSLATSPFSTGLLTAGNGAFNRDIWVDADAGDLQFLLSQTPTRPATPAIGESLRRVLLTSATAPEGESPTLGGARLMALARLGFLEEARTIASLSSAPQSDPYIGQALAIADLSEGKLEEACQRNAHLSSGRNESFWIKLRVICYVAAQETDAADLTYELLRETGALDLREQKLFETLVSGADLKEPPVVVTAIDLAIMRLLSAPVTPAILADADGGVIVSIARDEQLEMQMRLSAAVKAVSLGVMTRDEYAALMGGIDFEPAEIASAHAGLMNGKMTVLDDAKVFQAIRQMEAPEFLRDKAALIAKALRVANNLDRAHALSLLYNSDIASLEGALLSPEEAGQFALASMAVGNSRSAARWLNTMIGGGLTGLEEATAMRSIDLVNYLALLDLDAATSIAVNANIEITDPRTRGDKVIDANDETTARIVTSILDAATDRIEGQAVLTAAAATRNDGLQNPLMRAIIDRALKIAQTPELAGRVRFETAWSEAFVGVEIDTPDNTAANDDGFGPRLKPASAGD